MNIQTPAGLLGLFIGFALGGAVEKPFKEIDAREILSRCEIDNYITIDERGVWPGVKRDLSMQVETELLGWRPARVFRDDENAPDIPATPGLPFPFNARELAAFMIDGVGIFVAEFYGGWGDAPDPDVLNMLDGDTKAKAAVIQAFNAYREAKMAVTQEPEEAPEADAMVRYLLEPLTTLQATTPSPAPVVPETTVQRRARYLVMFEIEEKQEKRGALQRVADSEGVDRANMKKDIDKARAVRDEQKRAGSWTSQLVQDGKRKC